MTRCKLRQPEPPPVMDWCALLEHLYQPLDAILNDPEAAGAPPDWNGLLATAALYFNLEQLTLHAGQAPTTCAQRTLSFPLAANPAATAPPSLHLRAMLRPGPLADKPDSSRQVQLRLFVSHLERSLQLQHHLASKQRAVHQLHSCLNRLPTAMVLCEADGRAVFVNRAAVELAARIPALHLDRAGCRYVSSCPGDEGNALSALFERARQSIASSATLGVELTTESVQFTLIQLHREISPSEHAASGGLGLIIQPPPTWARPPAASQQPEPLEAPEPLRQRLQSHCGLSKAEAQLAHALSSGLSMAAYAKSRGRSVQTLRKQAQSLFAKLSVHSQKDLIVRVRHEQQADWVECVKLLVDGHKPAVDPSTWLYPQQLPDAVEDFTAAVSSGGNVSQNKLQHEGDSKPTIDWAKA